MPTDLGGQAWSMLEWFLVNEQFGRVTNGLHWHVPGVYNVWIEASPEQVQRYVVPALRGEGGDAYAVTEADAGSDPSGITTTAVATDAGWRLNGEKWFVTSGDVARVLIVVANVIDGVGVNGTVIYRDLPMVAVTGEFDDAGAAIDAHFKFHGVRSSWSRRASCFHRDGSTCADDGAAFFWDWEYCHNAAAMAAASAVPDSCGAACFLRVRS